LVEKLGSLAEQPWSEYRGGKAITQAQLARLLKPYGIASKQIRVEKNSKGYEREQFEEAWARYLADSPAVSDRGAGVEGTVSDHVSDRKALKSASALACIGVSVRGPLAIKAGRPGRRIPWGVIPA
jgi:hypothetical protein